ncbi:hypothetical protein ASD99_01135 [Mesorhizobium sp. Root695]|jgi:hypothetical protein|nr:hypothetical protein ASD12_12205 [Mesorhizobium sp. Root102]KRB34265.1 hypothetical protein ASD99_01135 [Mesorhizobium sp. Root695]
MDFRLLVFLLVASPALAQDHTSHAPAGPPEGNYGQGHEKWHNIYRGMHNTLGGSCCNGGDCRPTVAKFEGGKWWGKLNGVWTPIEPPKRVPEHPYSWNETAHICAAGNTVYCFIPPDNGT